MANDNINRNDLVNGARILYYFDGCDADGNGDYPIEATINHIDADGDEFMIEFADGTLDTGSVDLIMAVL